MIALSVPATASAQDEKDSDLSVSLGGSVWNGDFGAPTRTDIQSVLLGARYRVGGLRLTANIPYMRIRSDGTVFTGISGTPIFVSPMTTPANRIRDGLGDLTLGASYLIPPETLPFDLELIGRVKLPTAARSTGLSTRKADFSAGTSVSKTFGRLTPGATVTYRWFGDSAVWRLQDGFAVTAGASYAITDRVVILANYEYGRAATPLIDDMHELVGAISVPVLNDKARLTAFTAAGLSKGAADFSGGVSLSVSLF